eukprot:scaffold2879_cov128-Skeletonema_dohrnii-CCMP3373.AAC.14
MCVFCFPLPARLWGKRSQGFGIQDRNCSRLLSRDSFVASKAMARTCVGQSGTRFRTLLSARSDIPKAAVHGCNAKY